MQLLLVDDDEATRLAVRRALRVWTSVRVSESVNAEDAIRFLDWNRVDVVLSDYRMPGKTGIEVLCHAREAQPHARRVLMSGTLAQDVLALRTPGGCADFMFEKPMDRAEWETMLALALDGETPRAGAAWADGGRSWT